MSNKTRSLILHLFLLLITFAFEIVSFLVTSEGESAKKRRIPHLVIEKFRIRA